MEESTGSRGIVKWQTWNKLTITYIINSEAVTRVVGKDLNMNSETRVLI